MSEFRGLEIGISGAARAIYFRNPIRKDIYLKTFSRCAGNLFIVILSTQRIPGGDLVENGSFIEVKVANVSGFSDSDGTIVCHTVKFKEIESL